MNKVAFSYPHKLHISLFYVLVLVSREHELTNTLLCIWIKKNLRLVADYLI
jgi:hypothetical protein